MTRCIVILPQDVVQDIFSRLPVKSVERLRYLSKLWDSVISDQFFGRLHLGRVLESPKIRSQKILMFSPVQPVLVYHDIGSSFAAEAAISSLDFPPKTSIVTMVVGSCHGLICLILNHGNDMDFSLWNPTTNDMDFCLWNPTTRNYKNLPYPYCFFPDKKHLDSTKSPLYEFAFGFGYDSFSDDYKVFLGLRPFIETDLKEHKAAIFSTRENCWRIIQLPPNYTFPVFGNREDPKQGSFVNGALNWLVQYKDPDQVYTLISFDLKTERFLELPMPDKTDKDDRYRYVLGIFEGKLCLSIAKDKGSLESYLVEFWVMNEYGIGLSWSRSAIAPFQSIWSEHIPMCLSKDNQITLVGTWKYSLKLSRIDAQGKKLEGYNICRCRPNPKGTTYICPCEAIVYVESLIWPFVKGTCVEKKEECT